MRTFEFRGRITQYQDNGGGKYHKIVMKVETIDPETGKPDTLEFTAEQGSITKASMVGLGHEVAIVAKPVGKSYTNKAGQPGFFQFNQIIDINPVY